MRDEVVARSGNWKWPCQVVDDTFPLTDRSLLAHPDNVQSFAAVLPLTEFRNVLLDTLLRQRTLNVLVRILGIGTGDFVFIHTRCSFLEEVASRTTEHRRVPVRPSIVRSENED
jgi:hypothetical protein